MRITVAQKASLVLLLPVCGALATLVVFYLYISSTSIDEHIINVAGRQRMLSQTIFAQATLVYTGEDSLRGELRKHVTTFDDSLHALEYGGKVMGQTIPPAPPIVLDKIMQVKQLWGKQEGMILHLAAHAHNHKDAQESFRYVKDNIHLLTESSDQLVSAFQERSQFVQRRMLNILIMLAMLELALLVIGIISTRRYLTEHKRNEQALKKSEKDWRLTFDAIPDFVSLHDNDFRILRANKSLADFMGVKPEELIGKHCYEVFHCQNEPWPNCPLVKTKECKQAVTEEVDDPVIGVPLQITTSPVFDDNGEILATVHVAKDISERRSFDERLQYLAHHDGLTGLPNRTVFVDRLKQEVVHAHRNGKLLAVLFLDLDHFKVINDTLGHVMGDSLLKDVAACLSTCIREGDTVARQGGDEFVILLTDLSHKEDAGRVAQKIIDAVSQPFIEHGRELFISASIGISVYPDDGADDGTLLKNADIAMYRAKELGRNTYQFYQTMMSDRAQERLLLEGSLRTALQREEFQLYYQPKVDIATGKITGVEALLRWQHPQMGQILPGRFIPLLEETGLIEQVDQWVLFNACKQVRQWQDAGFAPMRVAVNLSARQFLIKGMPQIVATILNESGLDTRWLELEITETILMEHKEIVTTALHELNSMGVRLAIDDFGTGYSSLSYLKRFPIHTLKIDRSFVQDIPQDKDDSAITLAIIAMARSLDLNVVAEGVETREQLEFLRKHKCDEIQGFYFSPPVSADDLTHSLQVGKHLDANEVIMTNVHKINK